MNDANYKVPHCGAFSTPPLSSLLGPNIRLWILFSNTLSMDSSLNDIYRPTLYNSWFCMLDQGLEIKMAEHVKRTEKNKIPKRVVEYKYLGSRIWGGGGFCM